MRHFLLPEEELAAKFIDISEYLTKADHVDKAYKEANYLVRLEHENIVKLQNAFIVKRDLIIMTEHLKGGELKTYLERRKTPLSEKEALDVME